MFEYLSILLLLAIPAASTPATFLDGVTEEEYSVYSSLINSGFLRERPKLAIIQARTEFDTNSTPIPREFIDDVLAKTEKTYTLEHRFNIRIKYLLLSDAQIDLLFKQDPRRGWDAYWKKYPKATGLLTFSRVGFNATKNRAFVYASEGCGALCGYGYSFVLAKEKGIWRITEEKMLWIS